MVIFDTERERLSPMLEDIRNYIAHLCSQQVNVSRRRHIETKDFKAEEELSVSLMHAEANFMPEGLTKGVKNLLAPAPEAEEAEVIADAKIVEAAPYEELTKSDTYGHRARRASREAPRRNILADILSSDKAEREEAEELEDMHAFYSKRALRSCFSLSDEATSVKKQAALPDVSKIPVQNKIRFCDVINKLLCKLDLKPAEVYKPIDMSRSLFSRICSNRDFVPSKNSVLKLVVGFHLGVEEAEKLLEVAGYALSKNVVTDIVVRYFLEKGEYSTWNIDYALQHFGERSLFAEDKD